MAVSIVIPLFNRYELTAACVESIQFHSPEHQIILVDNGSTDATRFAQVTIRNEENRGFAMACNQGAEAADNEHLVFLNNDTLVHQNWLAFTRYLVRPEVGCVGPKLIFPSGRIQSAGIGINFDNPPGREAFNLHTDWSSEPVEVAAVTGACLGIRRDVFVELGGFDTGFWNGYEDVDLCLAATAAGYSNIYDPLAKVTHLESQSGPERWTAVAANVDRLRHKWSPK
jgi:GT2 family glycosyltransferase